MASLDVSDIELARRLTVSRQTIYNRRTGRTPMTADDIAAAAEVLDVDPAIFLGPPHEALKWLAEHRADELDEPKEPDQGELPSKGNRRSRCNGRGSSLLTLPPLSGILNEPRVLEGLLAEPSLLGGGVPCGAAHSNQ